MNDATAERMQQAAEAHLGACQEAFWAEENGDESRESPASAPFCGCDTCIVREVLYAGITVLLEEAEVTEKRAQPPPPDSRLLRIVRTV